MGVLHRAAPQPRFFLAGIPEGPEGVRMTLELMRRIVREWRTRPEMRSLAENIIGAVPQKNFTAEAAALQNYVRDNVRYTLDVNDVETVKTPDVILASGHGDCDDQALLLATLLETVGHPARFAAIAFEPDNFEHVYVETLIGERWLSAETTEPVELGWQPEGVVSKMLRHI